MKYPHAISAVYLGAVGFLCVAVGMDHGARTGFLAFALTTAPAYGAYLLGYMAGQSRPK